MNDFTQGSPQWFEARRGRLTASLASKLLTPSGKPSSSARKLCAQLVCERMGLQDVERGVETEWMTRGLDMEEEALRWFAFIKGYRYERPALIELDEYVAFSPDAVLPDITSPLEIKCPKPHTHVEWLSAGVLPLEHKAQVHFQMYVMGYPSSAFFMSYCPPLKPLIFEVLWDDYTDKMGKAIEDAVSTMIELEKVLKNGQEHDV